MYGRPGNFLNAERLSMVMFVMLQIFVFGIMVLAGIYFLFKEDLPQLPDNLKHISTRLPTEIYASDGELIRVLGERVFVDLGSISPDFQKAVIAVEDSNFYRRYAIDHLSFIRAIYINIKNRKIVQGASTITQQLSKNLFFSFEKRWSRKLKELLIALQMEAEYSKDEILEAYCNQIYFGNGIYGVEKASRFYFGKTANKITLMQSALLAGIPKSPNAYNPYSNYGLSLKRARFVLGRMIKEKLITAEKRDAALKSNLQLAEFKIKSGPNSHFLDLVISRLEKEYGREFVYSGGLRIMTTLNSKMQKAAQKSALEHLAFLKKRLQESSHENLEAALVCVDNRTGAIRSMLGGIDYSRSQFNRAISNNRSPGSSFKPFVYFSAMENLGYHPATLLVDEPVVLQIPGTKLWRPRNFSPEFQGRVTLKEALAKSLNIISIKLVYRLTPDKVIRTARKFGIDSPMKANYSIALGASGISPLQMASAYSVVANSGVLRKSYLVSRIEDFGGNLLYEHFISNERRISAPSIYLLIDMMKGVIEHGSGRIISRMGFDHPAGGKTGTTNDFKDSWFSGFTRHYTTSVWVGYDSNKPMKRKNRVGLTGSQGAAPIWGLFMKRIHDGLDKTEFPVPEGIRFEYVDRKTGQPVKKLSKDSIQVALRTEDSLNKNNPGRRKVQTQNKEHRSPPPGLIRDAF